MTHTPRGLWGNNVVATRLTIFLLVFLFLVTPVSQAFADESSPAPADSVEISAPASSSSGVGEIPAPDANSTDLKAPSTDAAVEDSTAVAKAKPKADKARNGMPAVDPGTGQFVDDAEDAKSKGNTQASAARASGSSDITSANVPNALDQKLSDIDQNSGAFVNEYPITVPPGRNGLQPDVKLQYNSQNTQDVNIFGYGWSVNIPYIERINRKGTDQLYSQNYFNSSMSGELVDSGSGIYKSKVDNGQFLNYSLVSDVWTVKDKNGTVYKFGTNAAERQDDPNDATHIYKYMLQEIRDTNNNYIKYSYYKDAGQIYPATIVYTGNATTDGIFVVNFVRSSRSDTIKSYKTGFLVTSNYRITEINTTISGTWYHKYVLAYGTGDNGLRSRLASITESGRDDSLVTKTLPATTFTYQASTPGWDLDNSHYIAPTGLDENRNIIDLTGDTLLDIIYAWDDSLGVQDKKAYIQNQAAYTWANNSSMESPLMFRKWEYRGGNGQLWDNGVRMFDYNGDGFPDMVQGKAKTGCSTACFAAYDNSSGSSWSLDATWTPMIALTDANSGIAEDYSARGLDLNGDGLTDLTRQEGNYQGTQLNTGSGFGAVTSAWDTPVDVDTPFAQHTDVNNDGLPDLLYSQRNNTCSCYYEYAYLNTGIGAWTNDTALLTPLHFVGAPGPDTGVRFIDVNGDGLVDTVVDPQTPWDTQLGRGNGWGASNSSWNLPIPGGSLIGGYSHIGDFNGDGLVDFLKTGGNPAQIYLHRGVEPDLLSRVTYPTGGYTDITYQKTAKYRDGSNNLLNPNLPYNLTTVKTITNNDGVGVTSGYTYSYEGGKYFYNNAFDRQLSGFAKIKQTDSAGNLAIYYYHQGDSSDSSHGEYSDDEWKIGKLYRVEQYDNASNLYSKTINKWDDYSLGSGSTFVKMLQSVESTYDSDSSHKDKATAYSYDNANGNVTQKIEYGEVTGADDGTFTDSGTDDFTTAISYASNTGANILGLPSQVTVTDHSAAKAKESKYYYDAQSLASVTKGNLTKREDWKTSSTYVNIQKTYNSTYGTLASDIDQRGKTTTYTNDTNNLYPATVTDPLTHVTSYTYDYSSGKVIQKTDPNTRVYQNVYDGLDRVITEKQPDLTTPSTLVTKAAYVYTDTSGAVNVKKSEYLDASTIRDSYVYFDGLGRKLQERKEAESTNFSAKDYAYNNIGQLDKESLPYFSTGSSKTSPTGTSALYITYAYDPLYRVTTTTNAVGTTTNTYSDWKLTVTDPRSKTKDLYKDAYGNLVQVDEHNSGSTYSTYYTYDYLGDLLGMTDALSNIRNFTYDGLGRRLTAQDLHASGDATFGSWTYTYDDAGNLTQSVDPKSQTINYSYDDENRPLTEDYTGAAGTEVTYSYDSGTDGKDQLTGITTADLTQTNTYNANRGLKSESKVVSSTTYTTSYTYDRLGNQVTITNPDSSQIKYLYNSAGLLNSVQRKESTDGSFINVVSNFDYSPLEQGTVTTYANGMSTTNTYDAAHVYRLSTKVTTIASSVHGQDLTYTYDNNGNITQIVDASGTNSSKTVAYTYDDLNRLTSATATGVASGQSTYTENYAYDAIGNLTSKTGPGSYTYAGNTGGSYANPHAATTIGADTLTYDNNGNMLTKGSTYTNTWNYTNRITQTVAGANTVTFKYDPTGMRLTYTKGATTTVYPSKFYNIAGSTRTKHIFANGAEIATVTGTGASAVVHSTATDTLTGSNIVTNSSDVKEELLDYFPFGSVRLDEKAGSYSDQRQYAGSEFDADTGLNYMEQRYYDSAIGKFVSEDKAFLAVGDNRWLKAITQQDLAAYLVDPQNLNSYSYVKNNPLRYIDPDGQFYKQLWQIEKWAFNTAVIWVGGKAESAYHGTYAGGGAVRWLMDHPNSGLYVAVGASLGVEGLALASALGVSDIGSLCIANCGNAGSAASSSLSRATSVFKNSDGRWTGQAGNSSGNRIVHGSLQEAREAFEKASYGYTSQAMYESNQVTVRVLDDGSSVTFRTVGSSGAQATIDIRTSNGTRVQTIKYMAKEK